MALFKFGKKKQPDPPATEPELLWTKTFEQSRSFKGCRRVQLSTFKKDGVAETIAHFKDLGNDFTGRTIRLDHVRVFDEALGRLKGLVNVYVDDMPIGTVFDTNDYRYPILTDFEYDKAHIRIEDGKVLLFVHVTEE